MKKLTLILAMLALMAVPTWGDQATAVYREGSYIATYKITDADNHSGYNNNIVTISHRINEAIVQTSGVDFSTVKTDWGCWGDASLAYCPDDWMGEDYREPIIVFLNDLMGGGYVTRGADLSDLRTKELYGMYWNEWILKAVVTDLVTRMVNDGLNATQQKRILKFSLIANGIPNNADPDDYANEVAIAYIDVDPELVFDDFGLATVPQQYRKTLRLFGETGWFE